MRKLEQQAVRDYVIKGYGSWLAPFACCLADFDKCEGPIEDCEFELDGKRVVVCAGHVDELFSRRGSRAVKYKASGV